jgi:hypothetical protein
MASANELAMPRIALPLSSGRLWRGGFGAVSKFDLLSKLRKRIP